jgi:hypothetical protein
MIPMRSAARWAPVVLVAATAAAWPTSHWMPGAACVGNFGVGSRDGFLQFIAATRPVNGDGARWRLGDKKRGVFVALAPECEWLPSISGAIVWIGSNPTPQNTLRVDVTYIPYALIVAASGSLALLSRRLTRRRTRPGCCARCGYELTGNRSGVCPECGTPTGARAGSAAPRAAG